MAAGEWEVMSSLHVQQLEDPCLDDIGRISQIVCCRNIFVISTANLCIIRWDAVNGLSEKIEVTKPRSADDSIHRIFIDPTGVYVQPRLTLS